jgi:hypothetical protein
MSTDQIQAIQKMSQADLAALLAKYAPTGNPA